MKRWSGLKRLHPPPPPPSHGLKRLHPPPPPPSHGLKRLRPPLPPPSFLPPTAYLQSSKACSNARSSPPLPPGR
ncbi:unnamed protein product [Closterium sp. NIES-53]